MPKLSAVQKKSLAEATSRYHGALNGSPAAERLAARGLTESAGPFRLGYVLDPLPGHEQYRGMLAIPYLRRSSSGWSVVSLRFGCVTDGCTHDYHGKYNTQAGDPPRMYNTLALQADTDTVVICEGEMDTLSAELSGLRAVGVPGVDSWRPHWRLPFLGYETVFVLADNDIPKPGLPGCTRCKGQCKGHNWGMEFAKRVAKELPNAKIISSALGEDVNSEMVRHGRDYIRQKVIG